LPAFSKPVTAIEKYYIVLDRLHRPFVNQLVVEGQGRLDREQLARALDRASAANPGVALRSRGFRTRMRWVVGPAPRLSVHRSETWEARSGADAPFLQLALDPRRGPSCELQLVEGGRDAYLIFRSLHATMDGSGTRHWAEETLRALRGETPLGSDCAETDVEFCAGLNDEPLELPADDALPPCGERDGSADATPRWVRATIERAKARQVPAAIACVLARHARERAARAGSVRFNIPADLRFFHPEKRSTGNLIGSLFLEVGEQDDVESVSEDFARRLRAREHARFPKGYDRLRWMTLARIQWAVHRASARARRKNRHRFTATISYMGELPAPSFSGAGFAARAAFFIPPVAQQGCFVTGTRTGERMQLLVGMPADLASGGRQQRLIDALCAALTA
jgi:hypothetical protein